MEDVIFQWTADFRPIQRQVESITTIARGKTVHTLMQLGDDTSGSKSMTGLNIRNNMPFRRKSSQSMVIPRATSPGGVNGRARIPSAGSIPSVASAPEHSEPEPEAEPEAEIRPSHLSPDAAYVSHSPAGPSRDYFSRDRQHSDGIISNGRLSPGASVIGKKKPPPPPPPKRIQSASSVQYVKAVYGFEGQEHGDLSFKEGDRIKVLKKTGDVNDWWDGELNGRKGRFPANYCE
jgi:amphiphysin